MVARDRGAKPPCRSRPERCHDRLRAGVARDLELDERRMPVGRDGREPRRWRSPPVACRSAARLLARKSRNWLERTVVEPGGGDDHVLLLARRRLPGNAPRSGAFALVDSELSSDLALQAQPVQRSRHERERHEGPATPQIANVRRGRTGRRSSPSSASRRRRGARTSTVTCRCPPRAPPRS